MKFVIYTVLPQIYVVDVVFYPFFVNPLSQIFKTDKKILFAALGEVVVGQTYTNRNTMTLRIKTQLIYKAHIGCIGSVQKESSGFKKMDCKQVFFY